MEHTNENVENVVNDKSNKYSIDDCNYIPILTNVSSNKEEI